MQELIEAGYVYIAKPPLYKLKQGSRERYIEKESELEEILLVDKWEKIEITDRHGTAVQADRGALAALRRACSSSTRAGRSSLRGRSRPRRRPVPRGVLAARASRCMSAEAAVELLARAARDGDDARRPSSLEQRPAASCACTRRRSHDRLRPHPPHRAALFDSQDYRQLRARARPAHRARRHAAVRRAPRRRAARSRADLRGAARRGARGRAEGRSSCSASRGSAR